MTRSIAALAFSFCLCWVLPAAGQDLPSDPSETARFRLGPIRFTPHLAITEVGVDTNVFNDAGEGKRDTTATFGPGVDYWLRFGRARLSAKSNVTYTWFQEFASQRSLNNEHEAKIELPMARLTPFVDGTYRRGRVRPGFEIDTRAFRWDTSVGGGLDVALTPKATVRVEGHERRYRFREDEFFLGSSLYETMNRRVRSVGLSWRQSLTPLTTFVVLAEREEQEFEVDRMRDSTGVRVMPGFELDPFALIAGKVFVGFRTFNTAAATLPDFTGLVADVEANYRLRATRFDIGLVRDVDYSAEVLEPYYVVTDLRLRVMQKITLRWDVVGNVGRYWLAYRSLDQNADGDVSRTDRGRRLGGGIGYTFGRSLRIGLDVDHYTRSSPAFGRSYEGLRIGGSFTYGLQQQ
ncbi:MAG TPA: outer membrane beta-barrel protein [Vicinamibacterales bacterium]